MNRKQERALAEGYCTQILTINGEVQGPLSLKEYSIENIGKGGFRFLSDIDLELEDRVQVLLCFPNGHSQEVLGRICYEEQTESGQSAYGFSIIKGFYSISAAK